MKWRSAYCLWVSVVLLFYCRLFCRIVMPSDVPLYCQYCGTDSANFDVKYLPGDIEVYEYIVCGKCGDVVKSFPVLATHDDTEHESRREGVSSSYGQCDQSASGDWSGNVADVSDICCEIDLTDDDDDGNTRCTDELSAFALYDHQMLKNSSSAFSFQRQQNAEVASPRSATLDNRELSRDSLKVTREHYIRSLSCGSCTGLGSEILPVEGLKDVFYCSGCSSVHGVDDSMNYYDLLQRGNYAVEACASCGNTNPYLFMLEQGSSLDSITLRCMNCSGAEGGDSGNTGDVGETAAVDEHGLAQHLKDWIQYDCKCGNANSDLQRITFESDSNAIFVKCWVCQREDVITLDSFKPNICSCDNNSDSVDVKFDEYGYAARLVCLQCHAEMDCGGPCASDVAAAGDGTSTGRTRISSQSDIQIGDHIALHRMLGYWHHAIVTDVDGWQIRVVHYNGPSLPNKGMLNWVLLSN